jgi:hypothetical protein
MLCMGTHRRDINGMVGAEGWTMVGAVRSVNPFVEDVDSTLGSRRKEALLVNVWVGIGGIGGVLHCVFVHNPTSLPFSSSMNVWVGIRGILHCVFVRDHPTSSPSSPSAPSAPSSTSSTSALSATMDSRNGCHRGRGCGVKVFWGGSSR